MKQSKFARVTAKALIVLGTLSLTIGALAGIVNNNLLNGPRLANHIESIRHDPAVIDKLSVQFADTLIAKAPNAAPFRPVIENAAAKILDSNALSKPIRGASLKLKDAFLTGQQLKLEFTDTANAAIETINKFAPQLGISPIDQLTLEPPAGSLLSTIKTLQTVLKISDTLSTALPIAAAALFLLSILLAPFWRQGAQRVAKSVIISGGILAGISAVSWIAVNFFGRDPKLGTYLIASWNEFEGAFWIPAAILILAGGLSYTLLGVVLPDIDVPTLIAREWKRVWSRPANKWISLLRAGILLVLGALFAIHTQQALRGLLFVGAAIMVVTAVFEFNRLLAVSIEREKATS
jgi:hypothetical protein